MTLSTYASGIADDIQREGRLVLLRRLGGPELFFDVDVYSYGRLYKPTEVVGGIVQGDREERISHREIDARQWPGPIRRGDQVVIQGRTCQVMAAETVVVGGETVEYVLQVRGA